jgi:predicted secreted protein
MMDRRSLLKSALGGGILILTGLPAASRPIAGIGATDIEAALGASSEQEALRILFGQPQSQPSSSVKIAAPYLTTPGMPFSATISADLKNARTVALTLDRAAHPLAAFVRLSGAPCFFSTRLQLPETMTVTAHVQTDDGVFSASRTVKVTNGGYGMWLR